MIEPVNSDEPVLNFFSKRKRSQEEEEEETDAVNDEQTFIPIETAEPIPEFNFDDESVLKSFRKKNSIKVYGTGTLSNFISRYPMPHSMHSCIKNARLYQAEFKSIAVHCINPNSNANHSHNASSTRSHGMCTYRVRQDIGFFNSDIT